MRKTIVIIILAPCRYPMISLNVYTNVHSLVSHTENDLYNNYYIHLPAFRGDHGEKSEERLAKVVKVESMSQPPSFVQLKKITGHKNTRVWKYIIYKPQDRRDLHLGK